MDPKTSGTKGDKRDLQGEGNHDATHHYNDGVEKSVQKGDAAELAEKAKKALEGPEGDELRRAEQEAKRGLSDRDAKK
jgi:hypothetical protein